MAYYVILSKLTDEGRKTLKEKPSRILEVEQGIEGYGGKGQRAVCGVRSL